MFYIRADGNDKIGMGHIMRCLAIAKAVRACGEEVTFLTADDKPVKTIEENGFSCHILFTYYDEMDVELPQLVLLLAGAAETDQNGKTVRPKILIDSYFVTEFYLQNLRLSASVILMDDMKTRVYPCDVLINYNIYGPHLGYENDYPEQTRLLLGASFVPLRKEFCEKKAEIRDRVRRILITTGGGDSCHMALNFARKAVQQDDFIYDIICGPFCPDTEALKKMAQENACLQIHENVTNMSEIMLECDLAVSAAGSTLYELCALGIPTIGFYFVENQRRNMEAFASGTPILNAGDFSQDPDATIAFIRKEIEVLSASKEIRERISTVMKALVDGQGAERLAGALLGKSLQGEKAEKKG